MNALLETLYTALDTIHSSIPAEAKEVGMTTPVALKHYVPHLVDRAELIEYYISKTEAAEKPYTLEQIQKELTQRAIL